MTCHDCELDFGPFGFCADCEYVDVLATALNCPRPPVDTFDSDELTEMDAELDELQLEFAQKMGMRTCSTIIL